MVAVAFQSLSKVAFVMSLAVGHAWTRNIQAPNVKLPPGTAGTKEQVKQAFTSAYNTYHKYAFGHDDVQPESKTSNDMRNGWGATIFDAMDTMLLMGLDDIYAEAVKFVGTVDFSTSKTQQTVSVFETTIRYLGGMLSAYELNQRKDAVLLTQAVKLADKLLHAWNTDTGVPYGQLDFTTNQPVQQNSNIAEAGTLTLEFGLLSALTGNDTYRKFAEASANAIMHNDPPLPFLPAQGIDPTTGGSVGAYVTWGGGSDSYFEYLIKFARLFSDADDIYADTWFSGVESSIDNLLRSSTVGNHLYVADFDGQNIRHLGSHLACFLAGNWIMGGRLLDEENLVNIALELNEGCWNTYQSTSTHIGPEVFAFESQDGSYTGALPPSPADAAFYQLHGFYIVSGASYYILRPEVLESNFYAFRATGNPKYLERAKQTLTAFNKVLSINGGFDGINDVNSADGEGGGFIDDMQSFFFAETMKYLYLTFDDPERISLDKYVFNTEAHPYPVGPSNLHARHGAKANGIQPPSNDVRGNSSSYGLLPNLVSRASSTASGPVPQISPNPKVPKQLADILGIWALPLQLGL